MKVQARQFEKKAENKAVVNSTREAQTFSFEELFTLKNDLLQLTYYLSFELRNSFRSTISFALNEKFIKKKKIKKFMIFMLEVNNICHNLHEMIIHLEKNKCNEIDQFSVDMLVDLLYYLTVVPNNRCIRICMGNTVIDILLLSDEMYLSNYMKISCWVLCLISIDPKGIKDTISINKGGNTFGYNAIC